MKILPVNLTDGYKVDHRSQYPLGTNVVYSNWTARKSRVQGVEHTVSFGLQYFIKEYLQNQWNNLFFRRPLKEVVEEYKRRIEGYLGKNAITYNHIEELHKLGYLPIRIKALPEGTLCPIKVPQFTVVNTIPHFFWLTNFLESIMSCVVWLPSNSATISHDFRNMMERYAEETNPEGVDFVPFQGHDFSFRGMGGLEAAAMSGAGHLLSFVGTDTIPAIDFLEKYYNADSSAELVGCSVSATEHSVMSMGTDSGEFLTFKRLITQTYPEGILSIVSDTWDLWNVLTDYLPTLKETILSRNGKVVVRPDSGNPVKILCGDRDASTEVERKGVVQLLWDTFGGTTSSTGYKVLDPHIGAIYGDGINKEVADAIFKGLKENGFASTNVVLGMGSYLFQYQTRDTFGHALKSTYGEVFGEGREIYKDPVTDNGLKKSARGLISVHRNESGELYLRDHCSWGEEGEGELQVVFENGKLLVDHTLSQIRKRLNANKCLVVLD